MYPETLHLVRAGRKLSKSVSSQLFDPSIIEDSIRGAIVPPSPDSVHLGFFLLTNQYCPNCDELCREVEQCTEELRKVVVRSNTSIWKKVMAWLKMKTRR